MNPDSEIYRLRSLVCQDANVQSKFAFRQNRDTEYVLTFDKVEGQLFLLYHRFWQKVPRMDAHNARLADSGVEFGTSGWIDKAMPAIFLNN